MSASYVLIFLLHFGQLTYCKEIGQHKIVKRIFAQTLARHGDRNIHPAFPSDPHKSEENWPGGYETLTSIGMQQHYELGQYLRQRYSDLIGNYSPNTVYVLSTDEDRTLMSAESNLAGMFPPSGDQIWNEDLAWRPVPVHTLAREYDYFLHVKRACDRYEYEMTKYLNENDRFDRLIERHRPLIDYLKEHSGLENPQIKDIDHIYDTLSIEQSKGFKIQDWGKRAIEPDEELEHFVMNWLPVSTATREMKKFKAGYFLKQVFDRFTNKSQSTLSPDLSLYMYFGHDHTMINILNSLGLFDKPHKPPYASCLFFELYQDIDDSYYVQIFYKNSTVTNIPPMEIPYCGVKCPLPKLYEIYSGILPSQDYDTGCALRDGETLPPEGNPSKKYL